MRKQNVVTVLAPAKLNLALDVVGLLPNGYHDLDMTMQAITLYERVVLRRSPYLNLRLPGSLVAPNNKNTAIKAALAFFHYTGLLAGVDITIYKNTPVRAGMAGGSADAAAVLVGLNELYGARLSMSELCALGASIGADVPFALMGGTCRVQGVGDLLKPLPPVPDCWFTVVMPDYGVSTPEAFAAYDKVGSTVHPDCETQEAAVRAGALVGPQGRVVHLLEPLVLHVAPPEVRDGLQLLPQGSEGLGGVLPAVPGLALSVVQHAVIDGVGALTAGLGQGLQPGDLLVDGLHLVGQGGGIV